MKKFILLLMIAFASVAVVNAADVVTRDVKTLPAAAQKTISSNFPRTKVNHIKIDSNILGSKEFDVILDNGTELEFDKNGNLKQVEAGNGGVPSSLLPSSVKNYLKINYPGQKILKFEIDNNDYEVELFNGIELKFDKNGKFIKLER